MAIIPKKYAVPGYPPEASSLEEGEIAINTGDGRLYTKLASGRIAEITAGSTGQAVFAGTTTVTSSSSTSSQNLATVATTGAYSDLTGIPSAFTPSSHSHPLSQLSSSSATTGDVVTWNGSAWVASAPSTSSSSGSETLAGLTDTIITSASSGQALVWSGTAWINQAISYSSLTDRPTSMTPTSHAVSHRAGGTDAITPSSINAVESTSVTRITRLTQASYDAITTKSNTTLYVIID